MLLQNFLQDRAQEYTHKNLGLERVREALAVLNHPEQAYPSVLIAGTNGKGSVGCLLEAVLLEAGYKVGLYASPHVLRFTERIRVAGEEVTEAELEEILWYFMEQGLLREGGQIQTPSGEPITWFEKVTLLAFEVFRRRQIDIALLEVGLGGRLDATNVVEPLVSVITSIGKDHAEVLGDSLFDIAKEKLGVARPGKYLILGEMDVNVRNFLNKASRLLEVKPITTHSVQGSTEDFNYGPFSKLSLTMPGQHQLQNAATAIETLVVLKEAGFKIENQHVRQGLFQARLPGRLEKISGEPEIWLDGAHNEPAVKTLTTEIQQELNKNPGRSLTIIFACMQEKDAKTLLKQLAVLVSQTKVKFIFTQVDSSRATPAIELVRIASFLPQKPECEVIEDPCEALDFAKKNTAKDGLIVVMGSLYLVGEARVFLFK